MTDTTVCPEEISALIFYFAASVKADTADGKEQFSAESCKKLADLQAAIGALAKDAEIRRYELERAEARYQSAMRIMMGIHNFLYPPRVNANGKIYQFQSPHVHEQMQALSDRIRAIPDELAAIDAAISDARK